ncbi:MAG TPA: ABC transporter permease [Vicinamibacterales bacterium]|nr:ABC transporter permease [Vicinamibacterales bacterium]
MLQDIRYALRSLLKHKGVTAIAVVCIALGIGVNATIFSTVDGCLIQPFSFTDPENIVAIRAANREAGISRTSISHPDLQDLREQARSFETIAGVAFRSLAIGDGTAEPERVSGALISWSLFSMLGVGPALGRDFRPLEDRPGAGRVVIISDDLWLRRYNRDRGVLGKTILINARPHTVVGVMPPRFEFPELQEAWIPLEPELHDAPRARREVRAFARLRPGVSVGRAMEDVRGVASRLEQAYASDNKGWTMFVRTLRDEFIPQQIRLILLTMMGAVSLVLLIACANVANLLLARATSRHREIAVRTAIGAGRRHIVRQLLVESLAIAIVSVPLGVLFAKAGLRWLDTLIVPNALPYYVRWSLDARSLAYLIAVSVATGVLFGLAPAFQAARPDVTEALKEGARGSGTGLKRSRMRNALVVAEVAMSLILLVGAALFVRSFMTLRNSPDGFNVAPLMTMRLYLPGDAYTPEGTKNRRMEELVRRIETLPGVVGAAASNLIPRDGGGSYTYVQIEGRPYERERASRAFYAGVSAHFLKTLNVPILRGRDFTDDEGHSRSGLAVIGETMARKYWPGGDSIGRRFALELDATSREMAWFTVIGVTRDIAIEQIGDNGLPDLIFVPYPYMETLNNGLIIRVASGDPAQITSAVRKQVREADPTIPLFEVITMAEGRKLGYWEWELFGKLFAAFGVVALALAAIGVYGVLSYSVSQRTHEIGVRVALGAGNADVLRLVVAHGMRLTVTGVGLGLAGALAVSGVIRSVLFVSPTDPVSFAGVAVFLTGVALLASYMPARRATAVDPIVALRDQ